MTEVPAWKKREWTLKAQKKNAIVPAYFEVFVDKVIIDCGHCHTRFQRGLIFGLNEPVFVCPENSCHARNWVPVTFELK